MRTAAQTGEPRCMKRTRTQTPRTSKMGLFMTLRSTTFEISDPSPSTEAPSSTESAIGSGGGRWPGSGRRSCCRWGNGVERSIKQGSLSFPTRL